MFAIAAYASTLSYLISSPGVIRLVAKTGLDVIAFAAFSFVQGFSVSLQRALPGILILPSLEPVAAQMVDSKDRVLAGLSLLFKIELICVLALIIVASIDGANIVRLLSRREYSSYYYILPILLVAVALSTIYRVLEIIGSMSLKFRIFLMLWPLSIASVLALYFAVERWGLVSVLLIPIGELAVRVAILMFAFRGHGVFSALDPPRSFLILASAVLVLSGALLLIELHGQWRINTSFLAVVVVSIFIVLTFIARPLRILEGEILWNAFPNSWKIGRDIARRLSRP